MGTIVGIIIKIIIAIIAGLLLPLVNNFFPKHAGPYADDDQFTIACFIAFIFVVIGFLLFAIIKGIMEKRTQKDDSDSNVE